MSLTFRNAARALILDEDERVLLCRFVSPHPAVPNGAQAVWAAPGGGIEPGEDGLSALRRELREETGLVTTVDPPHIWHQVIVATDYAPGFDGMVNDYFLVRAAHLSHTASSPTTNLPLMSTSRAFDGGKSLRSPTTPDLTCSRPVTSPHR